MISARQNTKEGTTAAPTIALERVSGLDAISCAYDSLAVGKKGSLTTLCISNKNGIQGYR